MRLNIRGMRYEEAVIELDSYFDKLILANRKSCEILHGKGTGTLKNMVQEFLRKNKHVQHFEFAPYERGGPGITLVELK